MAKLKVKIIHDVDRSDVNMYQKFWVGWIYIKGWCVTHRCRETRRLEAERLANDCAEIYNIATENIYTKNATP